MTLAHSAWPSDFRASRWLIFGSLALNLFFIGLGGALIVRHSVFTPAEAPRDRSVAGRIERLAATLPSADAEKLRGQFRANKAAVESAYQAYRASYDDIRDTLRAEPFQVEAMRAAMAKSRAAHQSFDQILHNVIALAADEMTADGRNKLADWRTRSRAGAK